MDLSFLRPLFAAPGPWASVYLDATRAEGNADHQIDLRWRSMSQRLTERSADPATIDAIGEVVRNHPTQPGRYGLAVFATGGEVALAEPLPEPPATDLAVWGPLPHAMPLVAGRGAEIPYVRVLAGHAGGEITGLDAGGAPRHERVTGSADFPLRKVRGGGWSNPRYQSAAEESWKHNAGDIAAAVTDLAGQIGAEVVVVAGDPRSVPMVLDKLPKRWRERAVVAERAGESGHLDETAARAVAEIAARHAQDAVERYRAQRGEGGGSAGLVDVVTRLQRGQADTVLLVDDPSSTDRLWIGPDDPSLVAVDERTLRESGVREPVQVRADAALLRAIAGTGAELVLVAPGEADLPHGIGAVLRYGDGDTAA